MNTSEQAFSLGVVCAAFLLIGVLQQPQQKLATQGYESDTTSSVFKQFLFAVVVLLIMTFGIDIAIENLR